jgi:O-antigen ligase
VTALSPRLSFGYGGQVRVLFAAAAAGLSVVAVYSPKLAVVLTLVAGVIVLMFRWLPAGLAAFVVATFPEYLPGSLGAGATLAKPLGVLVALSWLAQVLARPRDSRLLIRDRPVLGWVVIAFVTLAAVSSIWASNFAATEVQVERLVQVAILLYVVYTVVDSARVFRLIVWAYLAGSALTAGYSLITGGYGPGGRLAALFDPNTFAAETIPAITISAFLALTPRRRLTRFIAAGVLALDLVAVALTQSRGGLVGLAVALIAALVLAGRARPRVVVGVVLIVCIAAGYYVEYAPAHLKQRFGQVSGKGSSGRSDEWRIALRMFGDHPVFGVGLGNFPDVEPTYATRSINLQFVNFVVEDRLVAHNTYLEVAAELGIVGFVLFVSIFGMTLVPATRSLPRFEADGSDLEFYARGLVTGAIGMFASYAFFSGEYEKQLWLMLGLLAVLPTLTAARRRLPAA